MWRTNFAFGAADALWHCTAGSWRNAPDSRLCRAPKTPALAKAGSPLCTTHPSTGCQCAAEQLARLTPRPYPAGFAGVDSNLVSCLSEEGNPSIDFTIEMCNAGKGVPALLAQDGLPGGRSLLCDGNLSLIRAEVKHNTRFADLWH